MTRRELRLRMIVALVIFPSRRHNNIYIIFLLAFLQLTIAVCTSETFVSAAFLLTVIIIRWNNETFNSTVFQSQRIIIIVLIAPYSALLFVSADYTEWNTQIIILTITPFKYFQNKTCHRGSLYNITAPLTATAERILYILCILLN